MPNVEKISIALPPEMSAMLREAVDSQEYASSSEVVREALREWSCRRKARQQGLDELRAFWEETVNDPRPHVSAEEALQELRARYQAIADKPAMK